MRFTETLDTSTVQEKDFSPLPEGWYTVQITGEEDKDTKRGGVRIVYTMEVLDEAYRSRKVWDSHNYICPSSPKAEEIARDNIKSCAKACGLANISDSSQLLGKVLSVRLAITKDEGHEPRNEVKGYRKAEGYGASAPSPAPTPVPQPAAAPQSSSVPPWKR